MKNKRGQESLPTIVCLVIIALIIIFAGLGEFLGVASDASCPATATGFGGFFFCNWLTIIFFGVVFWLLWISKGS